MRTAATPPRLLLLAAALSLCAAATSPTVSMTAASWADSEWQNGTLGATDCDNPEGGFTASATGRALSGSIGELDLDQIAEVSGVTVVNDGHGAQALPAGALSADPSPDAFADPLDVTALGAINLYGALQFPLDTPVGVLGQYGHASSTGVATGASGFITDSGGISLDTGGTFPELASLHVSDLLAVINPPAYALGDVADASLIVGALAGRATIEGCPLVWGADPASAITRDYLISSLDMLVSSNRVGSLSDAVLEDVDELSTAVSGLASNTGFLTGLTGAIADLLDPVLGLLSLGQITIGSFSATIDTRALQDLISQPFDDEAGIITVDPAAGTVRVDTAALLSAAYPGRYGDGLNGLAPNTELLLDGGAVTHLTDALTQAVTDWMIAVNDALNVAADSVALSAAVTVRLGYDQGLLGGLLDLGTITATIGGDPEPTLAALRSGTAPAVVATDLHLGTLAPLLSGLVSGIVNLLVNDLGHTVAGAVDDVLASPTVLPEAAADLAAPVAIAVADLFRALFVDGFVSLMVNAQNRVVDGSSEPEDWQNLAASQYHVAALRIGVLSQVPGTDVRLYLGHGSVGPVCTRTGRCIS